MLCYVMLCYVMLCYVMLCYVMLCCVMLCYVMMAKNAFDFEICQIDRGHCGMLGHLRFDVPSTPLLWLFLYLHVFAKV